MFRSSSKILVFHLFLASLFAAVDSDKSMAQSSAKNVTFLPVVEGRGGRSFKAPPPLQITRFEPINLESYPRARHEMLRDVLRHVAADRVEYMWGIDPLNTIHEETHGANQWIRNEIAKPQFGYGANGVYIGADRAVLFPPTKTTMSDVAPFIPQPFRNSEFDLYIANTSWDDIPTNIFDEWSAYMIGLDYGLELSTDDNIWAQEFPNDKSRPALKGLLNFTAFALAFGLAIESKEPELLKDDASNVLGFIGYALNRSMKLFHKAIDNPRLIEPADAHMKSFRVLVSSDECKPLREFLVRHFGHDWMSQVFDAMGAETKFVAARPVTSDVSSGSTPNEADPKDCQLTERDEGFFCGKWGPFPDEELMGFTCGDGGSDDLCKRDPRRK